jgi:hypothetical protein
VRHGRRLPGYPAGPPARIGLHLDPAKAVHGRSPRASSGPSGCPADRLLAAPPEGAATGEPHTRRSARHPRTVGPGRQRRHLPRHRRLRGHLRRGRVLDGEKGEHRVGQALADTVGPACVRGRRQRPSRAQGRDRLGIGPTGQTSATSTLIIFDRGTPRWRTGCLPSSNESSKPGRPSASPPYRNQPLTTAPRPSSAVRGRDLPGLIRHRSVRGRRGRSAHGS